MGTGSNVTVLSIPKRSQSWKWGQPQQLLCSSIPRRASLSDTGQAAGQDCPPQGPRIPMAPLSHGAGLIPVSQKGKTEVWKARQSRGMEPGSDQSAWVRGAAVWTRVK